MGLTTSLVLAAGAGLSIPLGALISSNRTLRSFCRQREIDSFVSYFGGGALLAAIAMVLVPDGIDRASMGSAAAAFAAGGVLFWRFNAWVKRKGGAVSQLMGMLLDFIPEAIALGAAVAAGSSVGYLLAILIALQNMPEGFAAYHEMHASGMSARRLWWIFLGVPFVGPVSSWIGYAFLSSHDHMLGLVMLFCSGGILYLIFEDIAPGAHLQRKDFPAIGAVSGFLLGMVGTMWIH